jgi:hypothetical protein
MDNLDSWSMADHYLSLDLSSHILLWYSILILHLKLDLLFSLYSSSNFLFIYFFFYFYFFTLSSLFYYFLMNRKYKERREKEDLTPHPSQRSFRTNTLWKLLCHQLFAQLQICYDQIENIRELTYFNNSYGKS